MSTPEKSKYQILINSTHRFDRTVALLREGKVVERFEGKIDIVSTIKLLLQKHKVPFDNVVFKYNTGPGSFTGLKIGAAVANVFNWALGKADLSQVELPAYGAEPNISTRKHN